MVLGHMEIYLRAPDLYPAGLIQDLDSRLVSSAALQRETFLTCFRYWQMPTFGRDTIRRFSANCSEMKQLAAWDFDNLLQVRLLP